MDDIPEGDWLCPRCPHYSSFFYILLIFFAIKFDRNRNSNDPHNNSSISRSPTSLENNMQDKIERAVINTNNFISSCRVYAKKIWKNKVPTFCFILLFLLLLYVPAQKVSFRENPYETH
jgi:hypothetical protein